MTATHETSQAAKEDAEAEGTNGDLKEEVTKQMSRDALSRKRRQPSCAAVADTACTELIFSGSPDSHGSSYFESVNRILTRQGAVPLLEETERFVEAVLRAIRQREVVSKHWSRITGHDDIITLIHDAQASGDMDETI